MRQLTAHQINAANKALVIDVLDEPGPGGASHLYKISGFDTTTNPSNPVKDTKFSTCTMIFQNGPVANGINGITHEALLAILIDRLESLQLGPYACDENSWALNRLRNAQQDLLDRTRRRERQGVEGTMAKDPK